MQRRTLAVIALFGLLSFALLASDLAHGHGFYDLEDSVLGSLGSLSSVGAWAQVADVLALPAIVAVLVVAFTAGVVRRCAVRIAAYAAFAAVTFLTSEHVAKPLVHETFDGRLSFPSGNVTAVCATAAAVWLALHPVLGRRARSITFFLGAAWVLLISVAVVGAQWHTPFDALGSVLLSVGVITAGGAVYEWATSRRSYGAVDEDASWSSTDDDALRRTSTARVPAKPSTGSD